VGKKRVKNIDESIKELERNKLKEYIQRELKAGFSLGEIKKTLVNVGHPVAYIEEAIGKINLKEFDKSKQQFEKNANNHAPNTRRAVFILIVIIILILSYLFLRGIFTKEISKEKINEINLLIKAATENDVSYCSKITEHDLYYDCYDKVWLQKNNCKYAEITNSNPDKCYSDLAITNKNLKFCYKIINATKQRGCIDKLYLIDTKGCLDDFRCIAFWFEKEKNAGICYKILDVRKRDDCFNIYTITSNNSADMCANIINSSLKDTCYLTFTSAKKNGTICIKVLNKTLQESCFFNYLPMKESKKLISDTSFFNLAALKLKTLNSDFSVDDCPYLNFSNEQIDSFLPAEYANYTYQGEKPNLSKYMDENGELKYPAEYIADKKNGLINFCYFIVALKTNNSNVCDNISLTDSREACKLFFETNPEKIKNTNNYIYLKMKEIFNCNNPQKEGCTLLRE
jgi:hypothetical protein